MNGMLSCLRRRWLRAFCAAGAFAFASVVFAGGPAWAETRASPIPVPRVSPAYVSEELVWSESLRREMGALVYLPPGYDSNSSRRYPVLYMLHGLGGGRHQWSRVGLFSAATRLIRQGTIPPLIIVTPEGESGYWVDHANNGPRYGSYVTRDLVGWIDRGYRTIAAREGRAIAGLSMGAHGAFQLAMNNPDMFAGVGGASIALRRHQQAFPFFGDREYFQKHDPVSLARMYPDRARRFSIWLDIGSEDPWYNAATRFHELLQEEEVPHTWHVQEGGGHDGAYWKARVEDYLRLSTQTFSPLPRIRQGL